MASGQGCIIIREQGGTIVYRDKCESCGWVGSTEHHVGNPGGAILNSGFRCFSCGKQQEVRIYG